MDNTRLGEEYSTLINDYSDKLFGLLEDAEIKIKEQAEKITDLEYTIEDLKEEIEELKREK